MKKRGLTWNEKINAYLRRREIRQARKHEAWLESVSPRLVAREWQGGASTSFQAIPPIYILTSEDDSMPGGRITLTSGLPVTISDISTAGGFYYTPYLSNQIAVFDGSAVRQLTFSEMFASTPATINTPFDVFVFPSGPGVSIETVSWVNDTTRAQAIGYNNGFLTKNSDATRRYIGTLRTGSVSGQTEDSVLRRFVFNMYNRVHRRLYRSNSTSHTDAVQAFRYWNTDSTQILDFVLGVTDDPVLYNIIGNMQCSVVNVAGVISVGLDTGTSEAVASADVANNITSPLRFGASSSILISTPGRHFLAAIELGNPSTITMNDYSLTATIPM